MLRPFLDSKREGVPIDEIRENIRETVRQTVMDNKDTIREKVLEVGSLPNKQTFGMCSVLVV